MDYQKNLSSSIRVFQVGDCKTGKSSLYLRYKEGVYLNPYYCFGLDFFIKKVEIKNQEIKFQFWDYHSGEGFHTLLKSYYKGCSVILISYDITNRLSFENVLFFYKAYNQMNGNIITALFLIGNKCDLEEQREVSYEEGKQLSESLGMIFMEVSAKEDYQVKELFEKVIEYSLNFN